MYSPSLSRAAITRLFALLLSILALIAPRSASAHEIPQSVLVRAFTKAEGRTLRLLVRVPLESIRDTDFPLRSGEYLDIIRSGALLDDAARLWIADAAEVFEDGKLLTGYRIDAVRLSLPSDQSFASYESAMRQMSSPSLPPDVDLPWRQAMLDVLIEYDIESAASAFSLRTSWARLGVRTTTVLTSIDNDGVDRVLTFDGDPGLVRLDPSWYQAAGYFVALGFSHILEGIDHLLFLLCLVIPVRRVRALVGIVTAFTVAHSITLVAAATGFAPTALWFPPLVETLIALSIVYMACENMLGVNVERRWMLAFGFGLVHGFGFSYALGDSLQFSGRHLAVALGAFNVGVELGQLLVVGAMVPVLIWLFRRVPERAGAILISAFVAHSSWHWMTERFGQFRAYDIVMPEFNSLLVADLLRVLALILVIVGAGLALSTLVARLRRGAESHDAKLHARLTTSAPAGIDKHPVIGPVGPAALMFSTLLGAASIIGFPVDANAQQRLSPPRSSMSGVFTEKQATQGKEVYTNNCSGCHASASHTGPAFLGNWIGKPLIDLFEYIRNSMPKSDPGGLSEDEYVWVTAYLLKINSMPAGTSALSADPVLLKAIRMDTSSSTRKSSGIPDRRKE